MLLATALVPIASVAVLVATAGPAAAATVTFSYMPSAQSWVVPTGVTSVQVDARAASGGDGPNQALTGGPGGRLVATITVTPAETLQINVGGHGVVGQACCNSTGSAGGFNGGGATSGNYYGNGGGGGGASDVRQGGTALSNRVVVAGGGGGAGETGSTLHDAGGAGGGLTGEAGDNHNGGDGGGGGGTQLTWGAGAGPGAGSGSSGQGGAAGPGSGACPIGGGGGGGYFGGGAGGSLGTSCFNPSGGGGGGSGFLETSGTLVHNDTGFQTGDGQVTITYPPPSNPSPAQGSTPFTTVGSSSWTVPDGVTSVLVDAQGAAGGGGGGGGRVLAIVPVTPGQSLQVNVGGAGSVAQYGVGGFNGGGNGGGGYAGTSGGGGGATDVRGGGVELGDRLAVAGGGGGQGNGGGLGGMGGGIVGSPGGPGGTGFGVGPGAPGFGGPAGPPASAPTNGAVQGQGGNGYPASCQRNSGGGGGGGYYGGGGAGAACYAVAAGGGGGSSWGPDASKYTTVGGWNAGAGQATIYYPAGFGIAFLKDHPVLTTEKRGGCPCEDLNIPVPTVGAPVDPGTGFQSESIDDLRTAGRGPALDFRRVYNSDMAAVNGPLGLGWTDSYNMSLAFGTGTPPATVTMTEETGGQIVFNYNATTLTYAPDAGRDQATLVKNASGPAWTFTRRSKSVFDFNATGQLIDERDLNGNTTTVGAVSSTQTLTDSASRTYTLTYSGSHVTQVAEQSGGTFPARTVTYTYTGSLLTSVTDVNGGITDYGYDASNRLAVIRTPRFHGDGALPAAPAACASAAPTHATGSVYDSNGRVICQWDALGRQTTLAYTLDGSGNVSQAVVTNPKTNVTTYSYSNGLPVSLTKGSGTAASTWSYIYDPVTAGIAFTIDPDGHTTSTGYDQYGNVAARTDALARTTTATFGALHDPLTATDAKGVTTTNTFDANGNLLSSATPLLDAAGSPVLNGTTPVMASTSYAHTDGHAEDVTAKNDADGNTWSYTYDATRGYVLSASAPSTIDNVENLGTAQTNTTKFGYDAVTGFKKATLSPRYVLAHPTDTTCTPPAAGCTGYSYADATRPSGYDLWGDVTAATDANGHVTGAHWDADHNQLSATDANNQPTTTSYDAAGEPIQVTRADGTATRTIYNADGTVAGTFDALGAETVYGYDDHGRETSVTDPLGRATTFGYDPAGNQVTKADPTGTCPAWSSTTWPPTMSTGAKCTATAYDAANEPISTTYSDGVTPNVTSVSYDADGQRTAMSDGGSHAWAWSWDSLHRLTTVTDNQNKTVTYGYADATKTGTGQQGQELLYGPTAITYPGTTALVADRHYDPQGRMDCLSTSATVSECSPPPATAATGQTNYTYNADSAQISGVSALPSSTTQTDTATVDNADHISGLSAAKNSTTYASLTYGRDNASQLNSVTSTGVPADNHTYTYNPLEQLNTTDTSLYGYDGGGNLTTTLAGATQYFDTANQLSTSVAGPGIVLVGTSQSTATSTTITVNYPTGTKSGDWLILGATFAYPNTMTIPAGWLHAATKSSGSVSGISDTTDVLKHKAGAETSVSVTFSGAFPRAVAVASYRGVAATSPVDTNVNTSTSAGTTLTFPTATTTVAGDQLVTVTGANSTTAGTWTPPNTMSARTQVGGGSPVVALDDQSLAAAGATGTRTATYSQSAELAGVQITLKPAVTQPTPTTYSYDTRGNRTGVTPPAGSASILGYDQANRLTSFVQGTTTASYTYNGGGLRMSKTVGATTTTFTWDTAAPVPKLLYDGAQRYIYGPDGRPVKQIDNAGTTVWYHHDQIASTRVLTDNTGTPVGTFTYDAYGNQTATTGTTTTPLGFNAQYTDPESGLIYLRARYYDPATGQFLSRDPMVVMTRSAYGYVWGSPLNGSDPTGLNFWDDVSNVAGDVSTAAAAVAVVAVATAAIVVVGPEIIVAGGVYLTADAVIGGLLASAATAGYVSLGASAVQTAVDCRNGWNDGCQASVVNNVVIGGGFFALGFGADPFSLRGFGSNAGGYGASSNPVHLGHASCPSPAEKDQSRDEGGGSGGIGPYQDPSGLPLDPSLQR